MSVRCVCVVRPSLVTAARTGGVTAGVERQPWGARRCVAAAAAEDVICLVSGVEDRAGKAWNTQCNPVATGRSTKGRAAATVTLDGVAVAWAPPPETRGGGAAASPGRWALCGRGGGEVRRAVGGG